MVNILGWVVAFISWIGFMRLANENESWMFIKGLIYFELAGIALNVNLTHIWPQLHIHPFVLVGVGYLIAWGLWSRKKCKNAKAKRFISTCAVIFSAITSLPFIH